MTFYPDEHPAFDMPEYDPEPLEAEEADEDEDEGYAKWDPKHPGYNARMSDLWDLREKNA